MAQVWSTSLITHSGETNPISRSGTFQRSAVVLLSCVGPASSVQAGMICDPSTYLTHSCLGGRIVARTAGENAAYDYYVKPGGTTPATTKIVAVRVSTGAKLSSGVVLTSEKLRVEFIGS